MPAGVEQRLREAALRHAGIVLGPDKSALIATRVSKRMRALELEDYRDYLNYFDSHPEEVQEFVNVITTNTTAFWREASHFTRLTAHVQDRIAEGQRRFRLWCAAASTGQEPYTILLTLSPLVRNHGLDLKLLATDIDTQVLARAEAGVYDDDAVRQVPHDIRRWGFEQLSGGKHRVVPWVRQLVRFTKLNLARAPFPMKGPLDVIFCRNVMIYLDPPTRAALATEFERLLAPGGLVMVGHSESLSGAKTGLQPIVPSVYQKLRSST